MNKQAGLLKGVCVLGLAVSIVLFGALLYLTLYEGISLFSPPNIRKSSFATALEQYDQTIRENPALDFRQHNGLLDTLEKKALDTENVLSVLKRRRFQAFRAPRDREQYLSSYINATGRARKSFPHSSQIGALAGEALVLSGPLSTQTAAELRELALLISVNYQDLSLVFSVYSGSMADPAMAMSLPKELFPLLCSLAQGEEREKYLVNLCIRTLLEDNAQEATAMANSLFETIPLLEQTILFGAEFFYDHGNYLRAAELFSVFSDDQTMGRQGDALWLAGFIDSARGLWQTLLSRNRTVEEVFGQDNASAVKARASYNLAATAPTVNDAERWLEELFSYGSEYEPGQVFGVIRYSRLVPLDKAIVILDQTDNAKEGLFDLELVRRRSANWTVDRTVAETWLLLNRHPADGRLYEWAVWYFDFQRRYEETALALRNTGINRVEGPWSALHRAYAMLRQGQLTEAEQTLRSIVRSPESARAPGRFQQPLWQARADLGLVLEKLRNYEEALQCYEIATGQLAGLFNYGEGRSATKITPEQQDAAKVQVYIARVFRTVGKTEESLRALDYALDLDPENMEAKLEKRRFEAAPAVKLAS
jgi:tetratricopeptide (TPR) repeat protein